VLYFCAGLWYQYSAMLCIARTMPSLDVRLSVRPSHAGIYCRNGQTYPQTFFTTGYPRHSSFSTSNSMVTFRPGPHNVNYSTFGNAGHRRSSNKQLYRLAEMARRSEVNAQECELVRVAIESIRVCISTHLLTHRQKTVRSKLVSNETT